MASEMHAVPGQGSGTEIGVSSAPQHRVRTAGKVLGGLPRRDLVLLPLISLVTIVILFGIGEKLSHLIWIGTEDDACVASDPVLGFRAQPNCTSSLKAMEGPWITNTYNDCGYRSPTSCAPLPPGSLRVAVLGASTSAAYLIPEEDSFTAVAAQDLLKACGRTVDFQSLGIASMSQEQVVQHADQALALKPTAIMWVLAPFDIENIPYNAGALRVAAPEPGLVKRLHNLLSDSAFVGVAQHYLYQNVALYLKLYLAQTDQSDFLRSPLSPSWRHRVDYFAQNLGRIAAKAHASNVPLIVVFTPQQAQAAFATGQSRPDGIDPFAFGRVIADVAHRDGVYFLDATTFFTKTPWRNDLFYAVDGHMAAGADRLVGEGLASMLPKIGISAFASCTEGTASGS